MKEVALHLIWPQPWKTNKHPTSKIVRLYLFSKLNQIILKAVENFKTSAKRSETEEEGGGVVLDNQTPQISWLTIQTTWRLFWDDAV